MERERGNILHKIDWVTIALYLSLGIMGWFAICGASYSYIESDFLEFLSLGERTGKQAMWMGVSFFTGIILLCFDKRIYKDWSFIIYIFFTLLCIVTIFIARDIKGSRSWISLGSSFSLQPAEFMKFATTLALASFMSRHGFSLQKKGDLIGSLVLFMLPMLVIVGQRETGSALVYLSFFIVLYREGMTGLVLLTAVSAIVYFIVGIRFGEVHFESLDVSVGHYAVLVLIQLFSLAMVKFWCKYDKSALVLFVVNVVGTLGCYWIAIYLISFNIIIVQYLLVAFNVIYLLLRVRLEKEKDNLWVVLFIVGSLAFYASCDYVMHNVLKEHQRTRIEVLLGLKEDLAGAGYNVHQSKIAIGSGGVTGKGFLNGTQTKLKYVPEQDTDFIFCTIGEEQGFAGSVAVILVFAAFVLRLMYLAERQNDRFGRVYGYSLAAIFFFHFTINVGMVLGIMPVIGIPLPFFSYGGSSFLGFSILLFSFLRVDADRNVRL
ncbi:MAG: rod shape-determining protein RodA [Bacteroidaceae bacterium]|nr:rod shape-determining protein RodA [Bacteroidaceae bacterium]